MTERLYYQDSYLSAFEATALNAGDRIYLDRTAFYPTSGGQPHDLGTLNGVPIVEVVDEEDRVAHLLAEPIASGPVTGELDWARRFDHMQQHTGQHLLSAVLAERFGLATVSFHLGTESCTIDLATPSISADVLEQAERIANAQIVANLPLRVSYEDAALVEGLRKASERSGVLRVVEITGLDRSACGGTHVRATGEIGSLLIGGTEKVRQTTRLTFVCGHRAIRWTRQLRRDLAAKEGRVAELTASLKKLATENATLTGTRLYFETSPSSDGIRRHLRRGIDEHTRTEAISFAAGPRSLYLAISSDAMIFAASADSGVDAAAAIKPLVTRGGGGRTLAQGTLAQPESAAAILLCPPDPIAPA